MAARARPDPLGEEAQPDAHVLAAGAPLGLLAAQLVVARHVQRQLQRPRVVARVVLPAGRAGVRELLGPQQVAHPQLGRVHPELAGQHVGQPLDQVHGLGDAERAGVGDAARRLVGEHAGDLAVRRPRLVGAGEDVEEAGRELGRLRGRVERAVIGQHPRPQPEDLAVGGRGDLAVHVVVAGERGGHQALRPVLHPLHRPPGHHRGRDRAHVARVERDLGAEAAAQVGRDDPDLVLGHPGQGRVHRAVGVRRLAGRPQGQPAADRVVVGDRAAGLERRRVRARVDHVAVDHHVGRGEDRVGGRLVAGGPVEDAVAAGQVLADDRRAGVERGRGVDQRRQRLVVDGDQLERVPRRVPVGRHHERDLLALEAHLVGGQHRLHVAEQRRHPRQAPLGQVGAGEHGHHRRVGAGGGGVDRDDPGVRERAAQDRAVQHAGQRDVVDERALPPDEPRVLLARERPVSVAHGGPPSPSSAAVVLGGPQHRPDDVLVPGAPADLAGYRLADLGGGRVRVVVEQPARGHHHAGRAEAALQPVAGGEGLLDRVERAAAAPGPRRWRPAARPP